MRVDTSHEIHMLWEDKVAQNEEWFDTERPPEGTFKARSVDLMQGETKPIGQSGEQRNAAWRRMAGTELAAGGPTPHNGQLDWRRHRSL
jgi:hypothetical protein